MIRSSISGVDVDATARLDTLRRVMVEAAEARCRVTVSHLDRHCKAEAM